MRPRAPGAENAVFPVHTLIDVLELAVEPDLHFAAVGIDSRGSIGVCALMRLPHGRWPNASAGRDVGTAIADVSTI